MKNINDIYLLYLEDFKNYEIKSAKEQMELLKQAKQGDTEARDLLVYSNQKLVASNALFLYKPGLKLDLLDLIQEGNDGLLKAIDYYDLSYEDHNKFTTYATWWIRQAIRRAITNDGFTIRKPAYIFEYLSKINKAKNKLLQRGEDSSIENIYKELNGELSQEQIKDMIDSCLTNNINSLDTFYDKDDETSPYNAIDPNSIIEPDDEEKEALFNSTSDIIMNNLHDNKYYVVFLRFQALNKEKDRTYKEVAEKLFEEGRTKDLITRERIRQMCDYVYSKLKQGETINYRNDKDFINHFSYSLQDLNNIFEKNKGLFNFYPIKNYENSYSKYFYKDKDLLKGEIFFKDKKDYLHEKGHAIFNLLYKDEDAEYLYQYLNKQKLKPLDLEDVYYIDARLYDILLSMGHVKEHDTHSSDYFNDNRRRVEEVFANWYELMCTYRSLSVEQKEGIKILRKVFETPDFYRCLRRLCKIKIVQKKEEE